MYVFLFLNHFFPPFITIAVAAVRLPPDENTSRVHAVVYYVYFRLGTETIESCTGGRGGACMRTG